jgi:hypothetical protein
MFHSISIYLPPFEVLPFKEKLIGLRLSSACQAKTSDIFESEIHGGDIRKAALHITNAD